MTTAGSKAGRIAALDFTKGSLVLIMVLYHWINYFYGIQDNRYLRFLTPSFIFISGFIISNVYISKYGISDLQLPRRLIQRSLKIFGVFVLLNVARNFLMLGSAHDRGLSDLLNSGSLIDIYITGGGAGNGQAKAVAFSILVPISYLLILLSLLLVLSRFYRYTIHTACLFFFLCIAISYARGSAIPNLELLAIGLLGVIAGYLPIERVNMLVRHPYFLGVAYLLYLLAISVWNVIYPLQVMGVFLSLMILYFLGQESGEPGKIRACVVRLGKYSLVGYIAQIAILQLLRIGLNRIDSEAVVLGLSFVLAFALTILSVEILDRMRAQSAAMDRLYKAVFA
jgi:acyltransferase-like protein